VTLRAYSVLSSCRAALLFCLASAAYPRAAEPAKPPVWSRALNLKGALGYKDNVLLRNYPRGGSGFWETAADFSAIRLNQAGGPNWTFFATVEDRRYFNSDEVQKEQLFLAHAKVEQELREGWKTGAVLQYLFADQVFDASDSEELLSSIQLRSHNFLAAPFISASLPRQSRIELKFNARRQEFGQPLDDYWEIGPQWVFTKTYGHRSELFAGYSFEHRPYDTRRQTALNSRSIPGTSLRFNQHEFEAGLNHSWDAPRHWRTRLRFAYERNDENGTGYYDYDRFRLSARMGYYAKDWEATLGARATHYAYDLQPVPGGDEIRRFWESSVELRFERVLWRKLRGFAVWERELVSSNDESEEYRANTILAGAEWEF